MLVRKIFLAAMLLAALSLAACKGGNDAADQNAAATGTPAAKPAPATPPARPAPAASATPPPAPAAKPAAAPALPTDPKGLEAARKKAILAGQYDLALKVCAAEKVKSLGDQAILSCVLSACRQGDQVKAGTWGRLLKGSLRTEAIKVCTASHVQI